MEGKAAISKTSRASADGSTRSASPGGTSSSGKLKPVKSSTNKSQNPRHNQAVKQAKTSVSDAFSTVREVTESSAKSKQGNNVPKANAPIEQQCKKEATFQRCQRKTIGRFPEDRHLYMSNAAQLTDADAIRYSTAKCRATALQRSARLRRAASKIPAILMIVIGSILVLVGSGVAIYGGLIRKEEIYNKNEQKAVLSINN